MSFPHTNDCFFHSDELISLSEICQMTVRAIVEEDEVISGPFLSQLWPLLKFPTLWTKERAYNEETFSCLAASLYEYAGFPEKVSEPIKRRPFFLELQKRLSGRKMTNSTSLQTRIFEKSLGLWSSDHLLITLSGSGTPLGSFCNKEQEICQIGPQFYPLNDLTGFGVRGKCEAQIIDEEKISGWTSSFGDPEVWLQIQANVHDQLRVRFIGLTPTRKAAFVFYVKAKTACVGDSELRSGSLQRYRGIAKEVRFNGGSFSIESRSERPLELIPLAGKGCFWDTDFLLAIEMNSLASEEIFVLKTVC